MPYQGRIWLRSRKNKKEVNHLVLKQDKPLDKRFVKVIDHIELLSDNSSLSIATTNIYLMQSTQIFLAWLFFYQFY